MCPLEKLNPGPLLYKTCALTFEPRELYGQKVVGTTMSSHGHHDLKKNYTDKYNYDTDAFIKHMSIGFIQTMVVYLIE